MSSGKDDTNHAAEAGTDPGDRHVAAATVEPRGHEVGKAGDRDRFM